MDGLVEYGAEAIPGTLDVVNPRWRDLDKAVRQQRLKERVRGKPFYLFLGANVDRIVRMKPQNLVSGLPLESVQ
jgi:hypothetical protein